MPRLLTGLLIPFIALIARHPNARGRVGLDGGVPCARLGGHAAVGEGPQVQPPRPTAVQGLDGRVAEDDHAAAVVPAAPGLLQRKIEQVLSRLGVDRLDYAYGDSALDIPLLDHADHPVAVYPEAKLRSVAEERSWEIIGKTASYP